MPNEVVHVILLNQMFSYESFYKLCLIPMHHVHYVAIAKHLNLSNLQRTGTYFLILLNAGKLKVQYGQIEFWEDYFLLRCCKWDEYWYLSFFPSYGDKMPWWKQLKEGRTYSGLCSRSAHDSRENKEQEFEAAGYFVSTVRKQQKDWVLKCAQFHFSIYTGRIPARKHCYPAWKPLSTWLDEIKSVL